MLLWQNYLWIFSLGFPESEEEEEEEKEDEKEEDNDEEEDNYEESGIKNKYLCFWKKEVLHLAFIQRSFKK